jgi:ABC-type antimicrobial peptide transport system permease subunit
MDGRTLGYALAAGLATFLVVGVLVTELALSAIEFSLFVGLPVGAVAGLTVAAFVALGLADDATPGRRRAAFTLGVFGLVFLLVLAVELAILSRRLSISLPVAVLVAVGFALYAFVRATGPT